MKNTNVKIKNLSIFWKSLAFALGLAVTANSISLVTDVKEEEKIESCNDEHDDIIEFDKIVVNLEENYDVTNNKGYELINVKELTNYNSITEYKGVSIVDALKTWGINSSYNNRKRIAMDFGIKNYRGTASQNLKLLSILKDNKIEPLAKVSDIRAICRKLFGTNATKVISNLKLPKAVGITKSEFARIAREIAKNMKVDTSISNEELKSIIDSINDVNNETKYKNDIAWCYYMGYITLDENSNFNGNSFLTAKELNAWLNAFASDYNIAVNNNNTNDNGLAIVPGEGINNRDESPENNNDKDHDEEDEEHTHNFSDWKYFDTKNEISICNECGKIQYRKHALSSKTQFLYESTNDGKHKVIEKVDCNSCDYSIKKEYIINCDLGSWIYNKEIGLEARDCDKCGYEETRKHIHRQAPANLVYKLDKTNNNGTHKLKGTYKCNICGEKITLSKDEKCNLSPWIYNKETNKEARECSVCGYEETRKHEHSKAPANLVYILDDTNNNGTHTLKGTYNCTVCGEKITLYYDEDCEFGSWFYNKETGLEERECTICDYKITKEHKHSQAPSNLVYKLDKTNNDGTHTLTASYNCDMCFEKITLYKDEKCNLSPWTYNKETDKDERECSVCDYEETREHIHSEEPSSLEYKFHETNNNGTHKLIAIYNCAICNDQITLYKDESCKYSGWQINNSFTCKKECEVCGHELTKSHDLVTVPGSVTSNQTLGKHNETQKCNDCGHEKQVEVSCTGDGNKYYYKNGDIVTERENCSSCGDVCVDSYHNHNYQNCVPTDNINHERTCDCGEKSVSAHSYSDWAVNSEGKNSRECSECGYTEEKEHVCQMSEEVPEASTTDGMCKDLVRRCTVDGCNYEVRTPVEHDYRETVTPHGTLYTCKNCNHRYSVAATKDEADTLSLDTELAYLPSETELEESKNKVLVLK